MKGYIVSAMFDDSETRCVAARSEVCTDITCIESALHNTINWVGNLLCSESYQVEFNTHPRNARTRNVCSGCGVAIDERHPQLSRV